MLYPLSYEGRGMDWLHQTVLLTLCTDRALGVRLLGVPDLRGAALEAVVRAPSWKRDISFRECSRRCRERESRWRPAASDQDPPGRAVTARCGHLLRDTHTPGVGSSS